jgi:hypothetical protein
VIPIVQSKVCNIYFFSLIYDLIIGTQNEIRRKNIIAPSSYLSMKARQIALQDPFGTLEDQFAYLPSLQQEIQKCDADGLCILEMHESVFQRLFYSHGLQKIFSICNTPSLVQMLVG